MSAPWGGESSGTDSPSTGVGPVAGGGLPNGEGDELEGSEGCEPAGGRASGGEAGAADCARDAAAFALAFSRSRAVEDAFRTSSRWS